MPIQSNGLSGSTINQTNQRPFIPELWSQEVQYARDVELIATKMVRRFQRPASYGDVINIPLIRDVTVNTKTVESQVQLQSISPGQYTVRVDQKKEVSWAIEEDTMAFSMYDIAKHWKNRTAYALARDIDNTVLALRGAVHPDQWIINTSNGLLTGDPEPLDDASILAAIETLEVANVPRNEIAMFIGVQQHTQLLNINKYISVDYTNNKPVMSGSVGSIYGIPIYTTTNIRPNSLTGYQNGYGQPMAPTPGVEGSFYTPTQNPLQTANGVGLPRGKTGAEVASPFMTAVVCHPEWALWLDPLGGIKTDTQWDLKHLSDIYVSRQCYGTKLYRDDHVVLIHTAV